MTTTQKKLRELEGRQVSLALVDGSRIDDAALVSTGRGASRTLWIYTNLEDTFIPMSEIVEVWECGGDATGRQVHRVA
jgi:hypothetical protein